MKIAFIGAGRMAEALIARLKGHSILASDISAQRLQSLGKKYKIGTTSDNAAALAFGDIVILAVKPQQMAEVLEGLKGLGSRGLPAGRHGKGQGSKIIISIAAGIPLGYLQKKLPGIAIIRAMPNNPCLIGEGITALAGGKRTTAKELKKAGLIFKNVGQVLEVPEKWMNAVTGLSGSGPAFIYQVIEGLIEGGRKAGLPKALAAELALQTLIGAAKTAKASGSTPAELTAMVASPGGTTIEGLAVMKKHRTAQAVALAVLAAAKKSGLLTKRWTL